MELNLRCYVYDGVKKTWERPCGHPGYHPIPLAMVTLLLGFALSAPLPGILLNHLTSPLAPTRAIETIPRHAALSIRKFQVKSLVDGRIPGDQR